MTVRTIVDYPLNDINPLIIPMETRFFSGVEAEYWKIIYTNFSF